VDLRLSPHKTVAATLLASLLVPSLAGYIASTPLFNPSQLSAKLADSEAIGSGTEIHTVRELAGDPTLRSFGGDDFEVYRHAAKASVAASAPAKERYRFLVQGGLHGNEKLASAFVLWLSQRLAKGESPLNKLQEQGASFDFLPYANPDGTHNHSRYNAKGVNLNRNFGVLWGIARENPGADRFSEPETRAIRYLFKARKYTAAVDVHGYINWLVAPSEPSQVRMTGLKPEPRQTRQ
jgi:hypothetical protein